MIDAENLMLFEHGADGIVDGMGRGEVVAQRLLQHHAGLRRQHAAAGEPLADRPEQIGRRRQIEDSHPLGSFRQTFGQRRPAGIGSHIHGHIVDAAQIAVDAGRIQIGGGHELVEGFAHPRHEGIAVQRAAGGADDAALGRQLPVAMAVIEAWQDLAHGEIAGAAEHDEIEGRDGNELCAHGLSFPKAGPEHGIGTV